MAVSPLHGVGLILSPLTLPSADGGRSLRQFPTVSAPGCTPAGRPGGKGESVPHVPGSRGGFLRRAVRGWLRGKCARTIPLRRAARGGPGIRDCEISPFQVQSVSVAMSALSTVTVPGARHARGHIPEGYKRACCAGKYAEMLKKSDLIWAPETSFKLARRGVGGLRPFGGAGGQHVQTHQGDGASCPACRGAHCRLALLLPPPPPPRVSL